MSSFDLDFHQLCEVWPRPEKIAFSRATQRELLRGATLYPRDETIAPATLLGIAFEFDDTVPLGRYRILQRPVTVLQGRVVTQGDL